MDQVLGVSETAFSYVFLHFKITSYPFKVIRAHSRAVQAAAHAHFDFLLRELWLYQLLP